MVLMKRKNQVILTLVLKSAVVFSPLLLSAGMASGQPRPSVSTELNTAPVISEQQPAKLAQLQPQQPTPEQVPPVGAQPLKDRKSTRLNSSHHG
jgi:hypothetical protein